MRLAKKIKMGTHRYTWKELGITLQIKRTRRGVEFFSVAGSMPDDITYEPLEKKPVEKERRKG